MEAFLHVVLPRIAPDLSYVVRTFNGKPDLLKKLPQRLAGYAPWIRDAHTRVVVIVDRDDDRCTDLKHQLDETARAAGLVVASDAAAGQLFDVLNRIAVEELEAWLLGDFPALRKIYPRLPHSLSGRKRYRDPDDVAGGTWESLERELQNCGYHQAGLPKIDNARLVGKHMDIESNGSSSFRCFRDGVRRVVQMEVDRP